VPRVYILSADVSARPVDIGACLISKLLHAGKAREKVRLDGLDVDFLRHVPSCCGGDVPSLWHLPKA